MNKYINDTKVYSLLNKIADFKDCLNESNRKDIHLSDTQRAEIYLSLELFQKKLDDTK
jgi:hypothetical protein